MAIPDHPTTFSPAMLLTICFPGAGGGANHLVLTAVCSEMDFWELAGLVLNAAKAAGRMANGVIRWADNCSGARKSSRAAIMED